MLVSVDLSLRSSGVCILDSKGNLIDFKIVAPSVKEFNNEELLNYIAKDIIGFVSQYEKNLKAVVIEGLAYAGKSSCKDMISGNFWHLRCSLKERFGDIPCGVVSVSEWRGYVLNKEEQKEAKIRDKKTGLKNACVSKLPLEVREEFVRYIRDSKMKRESIYDLVDAYFLGIYRLTLNKEQYCHL